MNGMKLSIQVFEHGDNKSFRLRFLSTTTTKVIRTLCVCVPLDLCAQSCCVVANVEHCLQLFWLLKGSGTTAFAFSFLNGQLPGHEEAVPHLCVDTYIVICTHAGRCLRGPGPPRSSTKWAGASSRTAKACATTGCSLKLCIDQARQCPGPRKWDGRSLIRQAVRYRATIKCFCKQPTVVLLVAGTIWLKHLDIQVPEPPTSLAPRLH